MVGHRVIGVPTGSWIGSSIPQPSLSRLSIVSWAAIGLALFACLGTPPTRAADCPGHPDAIGTSRTLVVDPREHPRIGSMQYPETLPLADHEVVLTFDDGPLPRNSNQILQILADQCVKATFFLIGEQARAYPDGVRKLFAAGHTIGTHSQDHPLTFQKMKVEKIKQEIDDGIASVSAALPDPTLVSSFFRIPGLLRAQDVEDYLASQNIQIWSADFLADDWRHIPSSRVYDLAIKRLEASHKGILLLHDIQARTVAALPRILHEMKARGYRIVHVVPATTERSPTPTEPQQWQMHPHLEDMPVADFQKVPSFVFAEAKTLVASAGMDFSSQEGRLLLSAQPFERVRRSTTGELGANAATPWPQVTTVPVRATLDLPSPSASLFEISPNLQAPFRPAALAAEHAASKAPAAQGTQAEPAPAASKTGASAHRKVAVATKLHVGHSVHQAKHVAHAAHGKPKHQAKTETRQRHSVRVASLKKR